MVYITTCTKYPIESNALWEGHSIFSGMKLWITKGTFKVNLPSHILASLWLCVITQSRQVNTLLVLLHNDFIITPIMSQSLNFLKINSFHRNNKLFLPPFYYNPISCYHMPRPWKGHFYNILEKESVLEYYCRCSNLALTGIIFWPWEQWFYGGNIGKLQYLTKKSNFWMSFSPFLFFQCWVMIKLIPINQYKHHVVNFKYENIIGNFCLFSFLMLA